MDLKGKIYACTPVPIPCFSRTHPLIFHTRGQYLFLYFMYFFVSQFDLLGLDNESMNDSYHGHIVPFILRAVHTGRPRKKWVEWLA